MHLSRTVLWAIGCIIALIILLLVFRVGIVVGHRQAEYSLMRVQQSRTLPPGQPGLWTEFSGNNNFYVNAHGTIGPITSMTLGSASAPSAIVVHDIHDMTDKTVLISSTTAITGSTGPVAFSAMTAGERVAVVGSPNSQGQIVASIIRILPSEATSSSPSPATI